MARSKLTPTTEGYIGPIFQVKDLTAGVNLNGSPTSIKPGQARRLLNTLISNIGELAVYPGFRSFSTTTLASRRAQGGKRIYLSGGVFTLTADNGSIYKPSDAGVWGAVVSTGYHATNVIDFVNGRDIVAIFDGSSVPKYSEDGTNWFQMGITAPGAPSLSAVAGGSLVSGDTYEVSYSYFNSNLNEESNEGTTAQQAVSGANLTVRAGVTASADAQVTNIKVYVRDVTANEASRRLYSTVANTTGNVDITVNNWTSAAVAPTDHMVAVPMSFGVTWKNRWWGRDATVGNRLRFSQVFTNLGWPDTFYVDIPFERGESITALYPLGDVLVVFGSTKFYLIIGQTSLDFEVRPALGTQTGALGFRAVDSLENSIVHAGNPGVYIFNGATDTLMTLPIDTAWQTMMGTLTSTELPLLPIAVDKLNKELRVAVPNVYPTGTRGEWVLDLNRTNTPNSDDSTSEQAWFSTDRTIGGYILWDGPEPISSNQGRIFSWSPTAVKLFEERVGTSADGTDMRMAYDGYMLPFGLQVARVVDSYLEYQPSTYTTFTLDLRVDGRLMGAQSFNIEGSNPGKKYGSSLYGSGLYGGDPTDRTMLPIMWPVSAEGRTAQLLLSYVGQGTPKFFTYGHNIIAEALPRGIAG